MGLAISTHVLAGLLGNDEQAAQSCRDRLAALNRVLEKHGLPAHVESETAGPVTARDHVDSFPYSFLHYLRRAYAYVHDDCVDDLCPVGPAEDPTDDAVLETATSAFASHLLCHSDAEGFYVPIAFTRVIADDDLAGGLLGSSQSLLAELVAVAPAIGIELTGATLSDEAAAALVAEDETGPYARERLVWLTLFEQARVSIANNTLIEFG